MITHFTRGVRFRSAHHYWRSDWPDERNRTVFGVFVEPHWHDYELEVTLAGVPDPETGFAVDLMDLDRVLAAQVVQPLHDRHINEVVDEFGPGGLVPSTENLTIWLWRRIESALPNSRIVRVRLQEEEGLAVEYFGGDGGAPNA